MFKRLKTKNQTKSIFVDLRHPLAFSKSPGVTFSQPKANEASRLTRCRHCGWICDKERDVKLKDGSHAGFGINQGVQLTAGTSIGDKRVPSATGGVTSADTYFERDVGAGCPCCGSYVYDPTQPIQVWPESS